MPTNEEDAYWFSNLHGTSIYNKNLKKAKNHFWYVPVRHSRYGPVYVEPTFRKEDLSVPVEESDPRKYCPIKAAANEQTSFATYNDVVAKFIRILLKDGEKELARHIVFKTFENLKHIQIKKYNKAELDIEKESIDLDPSKIFEQAVENCKPLLKIEIIKRGGLLYKVPVPVSTKNRTFLAMRWLIESMSASKANKERRAWDKLATELLDAIKHEGPTIRKKQELHRACEDVRAYAHFRW